MNNRNCCHLGAFLYAYGRLLYTMYLLALFSGDGVSSMGHPAGNPLAIRHTISLL